MILLLLVPLAVLGAVLAWLSWRARQRRIALALAGFCLLCSGLSAGILVFSWLLYEALPPSVTG